MGERDYKIEDSETTFEILNANEFKVLKVIEVNGPKWNRFTGYLPYLRNFDRKSNNTGNGDELDSLLLETLKQTYPDSRLRFEDEIIFKGQLQKNLDGIEGGTQKDFTFHILPEIPLEAIQTSEGKSFKGYAPTFTVRLHLSPKSEKIAGILPFFNCRLPYNSIEQLMKTIWKV